MAAIYTSRSKNWGCLRNILAVGMMVGQSRGSVLLDADWWRNCCWFGARSLTRDNTEGGPGTRDAFPQPPASKFVEIC